MSPRPPLTQYEFCRRTEELRQGAIVAGVLGLSFGLIVGFLAAIVLGVSS